MDTTPANLHLHQNSFGQLAQWSDTPTWTTYNRSHGVHNVYMGTTADENR